MDECRKTNALRSAEFKNRYIRGRIIDIGAGRDLVTPDAEAFDVEHGDANRILDYRESGAYDCVHSSHCLEHMWNPRDALAQWWGLVRPGGHLVVVVPEENLYEQGYWPSLFNPDHKATFRLGRPAAAWTPVSYDIGELCAELPDGKVVDAQVQSAGYSEGLRRRVRPSTPKRRELSRFLARLRGRLLSYPAARSILDPVVIAATRVSGCPVDQTLADAVAQIQVVVEKAAG